MRRTAYLLCGDWHRAEDLVQTALARVVAAARRRKVDSLDARYGWEREGGPYGDGGAKVFAARTNAVTPMRMVGSITGA